MEFSRPHVINEATIEYLKTLDPQNPPNPETIAETILTVTTEKCREVNATRSKGEAKWRLPTELDEEQVARILARLYPIKRISYLDDPKADSDYILGIYQSDGENKGVYTVSDLAFKNIIKQYNNDFDDFRCQKVKQHLECYVESSGLCRDKDLIAVNNGIFNYAFGVGITVIIGVGSSLLNSSSLIRRNAFSSSPVSLDILVICFIIFTPFNSW